MKTRHLVPLTRTLSTGPRGLADRQKSHAKQLLPHGMFDIDSSKFLRRNMTALTWLSIVELGFQGVKCERKNRKRERERESIRASFDAWNGWV